MVLNSNAPPVESQAFKESLIAELLRHPDVVKQPTAAGADAEAWCPWHADKEGGTPSLKISVKKLIAKCFVCQNGGLEKLARKWGVPLPERAYPNSQLAIQAAYDYRDQEGKLTFQVVRLTPIKDGEKRIRQRQPDPLDPESWVWNLEKVTKILYRLPQLLAAEPDDVIWIVEGEKDADRLAEEGLVATTNPGGAGKWLPTYSKFLDAKIVAIIPDNDAPGIAHANQVATLLSGTAQSVRIVELPGLDPKGDVSDWLQAGHTIPELQAIYEYAPEFDRDKSVTENVTESQFPWQGGKHEENASRMIELMKSHGFFVNGGGHDLYFFDRNRGNLLSLDEDNLGLLALLSDTYKLNKRNPLFPFLFQQMLVEAHERGRPTRVRQFSYYDVIANTVLLDMGNGKVLKITASNIDVATNGEDGILFEHMLDHSPWEYTNQDVAGLVEEILIKPINFCGKESIFTVEQQRLLLLLWVLSMAFESMMPTRVLAVAVGPAGSGKTSMFRSCGQMLIGPDFEVDSLQQQQKGEEDFWVNAHHSFMVCYDNVDRNIPYLSDALAQVATGARRSRRQLHTTSRLYRYDVSCMLALTARTPTGSLRREDVADRSLLFGLSTIENKRPDYDIQKDISEYRNLLMSDYANMVQRTLRVSLANVEVTDPAARMADFFRVTTRIAMGLGHGYAKLNNEAMRRVRKSQHRFATEENGLATLLAEWICRSNYSSTVAGENSQTPNDGRPVLAKDLLQELRNISEETGIYLPASNPTALGRQLGNLSDALSEEFHIHRSRGRTGATWTFSRFSSQGFEVAMVTEPADQKSEPSTCNLTPDRSMNVANS